MPSKIREVRRAVEKAYKKRLQKTPEGREKIARWRKRFYKKKMSDPTRAKKEREQRKRGLDKWRGDRRKQMIASSRYRARVMGLPFDLKIEDIVIPEYCPVFPDLKLIWGKGWGCEGSATLDRLDCSKGYVRGNVFVISWKANRLKSNATLEDLEAIIAYVRTYSQAKP